MRNHFVCCFTLLDVEGVVYRYDGLLGAQQAVSEQLCPRNAQVDTRYNWSNPFTVDAGPSHYTRVP